MKHLAASFGNFKVRLLAADRSKKIAQRSLWVIHDREKFHGLIREVKDLINGVQDITKSLSSIATQDNVIKSHVMRIKDEETLDMVSDVCEIEYPSIADAASARADTISMATTKRLDITDWTTAVNTEQSDDITDLDVESLTITELKYIVRRGFDRNKTAAERVDSVSSSTDAPSSTLRTSESLPKASTPSSAKALNSVPPASDDYQQLLDEYEVVLEDIGTTILDGDFMDELDAIKQWFLVLSESERTAAMHALLHQPTTATQACFFTFALNQITKNVTGLFFLSKTAWMMDRGNSARLGRPETPIIPLTARNTRARSLESMGSDYAW
jgi:hypothetical protein